MTKVLLFVLALLTAGTVLASRASNPDGSVSLTIKLGSSAAESAAAINALAAYHGYQAVVGGVANPETKPAFVDRILREQVLVWIKAGRAAAAAQAARDTQDALPLPGVQ